jgi:hypothetical protein
MEPTDYDRYAELVINNMKIGELFETLDKNILQN